MRLGTTSYIYPADLLTNVRNLSGKVQDIEIVAFESDLQYLPDEKDICVLGELAREFGHSYTIHLPLDLELAGSNSKIDAAIHVMNNFSALEPHAYIIHLDGNTPNSDFDQWLRFGLVALNTLRNSAAGWDQLTVENLETQPIEWIYRIADELPVSLCMDVGHIWKQGLSPEPILEKCIERTRVIHVHGLSHRDHKSLKLMSPEKLDPVVRIIQQRFSGILTFEVFNESDWVESQQCFAEALQRIRNNELD